MLSPWTGRPPRPCRAQVSTEVERARCCGRPPANPLPRTPASVSSTRG